MVHPSSPEDNSSKFEFPTLARLNYDFCTTIYRSGFIRVAISSWGPCYREEFLLVLRFNNYKISLLNCRWALLWPGKYIRLWSRNLNKWTHKNMSPIISGFRPRKSYYLFPKTASQLLPLSPDNSYQRVKASERMYCFNNMPLGQSSK